MTVDSGELANMAPDEYLDTVLIGQLRQMAARHATSIAGLMRDGDSPAVVAERCARRRLARLPADLVDGLGADEALRRAAGLFCDELFGALSQVSEYALGIFRAAQDLAGNTPTPPPAKHAPDARALAGRLRYYADLLEQAGGYAGAADGIVDDLGVEHAAAGLAGSLLSRFEAAAKADSAGLALLLACVRGILVARA